MGFVTLKRAEVHKAQQWSVHLPIFMTIIISNSFVLTASLLMFQVHRYMGGFQNITLKYMHTAVWRKNAVKTVKRCKISFD